jgi:DNA polymerase type B, organellar and viral/Recombination endonuclease VII
MEMCQTCFVNYNKRNERYHQTTDQHIENEIRIYGVKTVLDKFVAYEYRSAFETTFTDYRVVNAVTRMTNIKNYIESVCSKMKPVIIGRMVYQKCIRMQQKLTLKLESNHTKDEKVIVLKTHFQLLTKAGSVGNQMKINTDKLLAEYDDYEGKKSGWTLKQIMHMDILTAPFIMGYGKSFIELPEILKNNRSVVNLRNNDDNCFLYCIIYHKYKDTFKRADFGKSRFEEHLEEFNMDGIPSPVPTKASVYRRFERQNNVAINVFSFEMNKYDSSKYDIYPIYLTKETNDDSINLLYYSQADVNNDDDSDLTNSHYCYISNLQLLLYNDKRKGHNCYDYKMCKNCFMLITSESKYNEHVKLCGLQDPTRPVFLTKSHINFTNFSKKQEMPYCVYADFEAILKPINLDVTDTADEEHSVANAYQEHVPFAYGIYVHNNHNMQNCAYMTQIVDPTNDPIPIGKQFLSDIYQIANQIVDSTEYKDIDWSTYRKIEYHTANSCYLCDEPFTKTNYKVRDHDHYTGQYRGAAHRNCNLNYKIRSFVPVVLHNMAKYDAHFFVKHLGFNDGDVDLIAKTKETFTGIIKSCVSPVKKLKYKIIFIDSFRFMSCSLDSLAKNLNGDLPIVKKYFLDPEQFNLIKEKGIYPYDYIDSFDKLDKPIPDRNEFYNKLENKHVSKCEYERVLKVCESFQITNMKQYTELYLQTDVLLLADVYENFRKGCQKNYGLEAVAYFSTPGITWDAALQKTGIQLKSIQSYDDHLFFERGIRGGPCQIGCQRYVEANNTYMGDEYDPTKPSSYILYLDENNQYGNAMSQPLPYDNFQYVDDVTKFDLKKDKPGKGYIAQIDMEYPNDPELQDWFSDLPIVAEKKLVPGSEDKNNVKLILDMMPKKNYVVHHRMLKFLIDKGIKVTEIHKIIEFDEKTWLKDYIDLNTSLRIQSNNKADQDLFKLMNNAMFGKTIENVRLYTNLNMIANKEKAKRMMSKTNVEYYEILDENLILFGHRNIKTLFKKPIYVGMSVLDLAKVSIFRFYYDVIKSFYKDRVSVIYTDTDSLVLYIKTEDLYADLEKHFKSDLDTSNYPKDHPLYDPKNNKVLGKFKDEMGGGIMRKFVALSPKVYGYKMMNEDQVTKAKGVKRSTLNTIRFDDLMKALHSENGEDTMVDYKGFKTRNHTNYSITVDKNALRPNDDKRHYVNKMESLPYGHYRINSI